jgi:hypothetical protein
VDKNYFAGQIFWANCRNRGVSCEKKWVTGQKKWAFGQKFLKSGQPKVVAPQRLFGFVDKNPEIFNI